MPRAHFLCSKQSPSPFPPPSQPIDTHLIHYHVHFLSLSLSLSLSFLTLDIFRHLPKLVVRKINKVATPTIPFLLRVVLGIQRALGNGAVCYKREAVVQADTEKRGKWGFKALLLWIKLEKQGWSLSAKVF
jgi:hypothetical protein